MRFWVVDLYRREFENRGISLIKIDLNLGLYGAGVCDTPLQYWGLSSEKLVKILTHPPILVG